MRDWLNQAEGGLWRYDLDLVPTGLGFRVEASARGCGWGLRVALLELPFLCVTTTYNYLAVRPSGAAEAGRSNQEYAPQAQRQRGRRRAR